MDRTQIVLLLVLAFVAILAVWVYALDREYRTLKLRLWGSMLAGARSASKMLETVPIEEKQSWPSEVQRIAGKIEEFGRLPEDEEAIRSWLLRQRNR